jgi:hypothetical protein
MKLLIGRNRTPSEFAAFVHEVAQVARGGFRQPSDRDPSGSLVAQASIAAGWTKVSDYLPEKTKRSRAKADARHRMKRQIAKERAIGIDPIFFNSCPAKTSAPARKAWKARDKAYAP